MITYEKLKILMVKKNVQWKDLIKDGVIDQSTRRLLVHDKYVSLKTLEKVAIYLNVDIGDIVSIKKEENEQ